MRRGPICALSILIGQKSKSEPRWRVEYWKPMEEQRDFLFRVLEALESAGVAYAVTGSWASTTYGLPRTTHDLDVVIVISVEQAGKLAAQFPPPFYADADWMQAAAAERTFFNVIDPASGLKVDFWPVQDDEYSQAQFERRRRQQLFEREVWMLAPEDVILSKLLWYQASASDTQLRDCVGIWKAMPGALDQEYLRRWAARLKLDSLLARVLAA